jgi:hypothetical protein
MHCLQAAMMNVPCPAMYHAANYRLSQGGKELELTENTARIYS